MGRWFLIQQATSFCLSRSQETNSAKELKRGEVFFAQSCGYRHSLLKALDTCRAQRSLQSRRTRFSWIAFMEFFEKFRSGIFEIIVRDPFIVLSYVSLPMYFVLQKIMLLLVTP